MSFSQFILNCFFILMLWNLNNEITELKKEVRDAKSDIHWHDIAHPR